jgi:Cell division GTPase
MKTVLVGVGQAGGKLADELVTFDYENGYDSVQNAIAINTAKTDLQPLAIETGLIGQSQVKGHGVGGDNELAAEIMEADLGEVQQKIGNRITTEAESIILTTGLGGGTGSGGTPVLARRLSEIYEIPVYVLAILPSTEESNLAQVNAGRSLKTITDTADATLVIDNDAWRATGESLTDGYERINQQIAKRIGLLLAAGEVSDGVAESVVDSSEVINTLRTGGLAAIGYN